jgi:DNA-binding PadR family transcriptional regulator
MITELEGAILTEIGFRQMHTAFKVRQAFKNSPSSDWQGSAGSVYPAINRLKAKGLIHASDQRDGRGTQMLGLTDIGRAALMEWALNADASMDVGIDPFRSRAGLWQTLAHDEQIAHAQQLIALSEQAILSLERYRLHQDKYERVQAGLAIEVQKLRLNWAKNWLTNLNHVKPAS